MSIVAGATAGESDIGASCSACGGAPPSSPRAPPPASGGYPVSRAARARRRGPRYSASRLIRAKDSPMSEPVGSWKMQFPGNLAWSNAVLVTQGMAPYDAVAMAEIDTVCAAPAGAAGRTGRVARRMGRDGRAPRGAGRRGRTPRPRAHAPAMRGCAPACTTSPRERFIHPGAEKRALGERAIRCQQAGLLRRHPRIEKVEVPFEGDSLPALFMKAEPARSRRARRPSSSSTAWTTARR